MTDLDYLLIRLRAIGNFAGFPMAEDLVSEIEELRDVLYEVVVLLKATRTNPTEGRT